MSDLATIFASAGEYTLVGGGSVVITALSSAVAYLWKRAEKEFDECKADRKKLWVALHKMGYVADDEEEMK